MVRTMIYETKKGSFLEFINQWDAVLIPHQYNWVNFDFIRLTVENDKKFGQGEIEFIILGLGLRFRWIYDREVNDEIISKYAKMIEDTDNWVEI